MYWNDLMSGMVAFAVATLWIGLLVWTGSKVPQVTRVSRAVQRTTLDAALAIVAFVIGVVFSIATVLGLFVSDLAIADGWVGTSNQTAASLLSNQAGLSFFGVSAPTWAVGLVLSWAIGTAFLLFRLCVGAYSLKRLGEASQTLQMVQVHSRFTNDYLSTLVTRSPQIVLVDHGSAPFTFGWRQPIIALPADWSDCFSEAEIEAVLLHELAHVRGADFVWHLALSTLQAFLWFNPFVHSLVHSYREAFEFRCDREAALSLGRSGPLVRAILASAEHCTETPRSALSVTSGSVVLRRIKALLVPSTELARPNIFLRGASALIICLSLALSSFTVLSFEQGRQLYGSRMTYLEKPSNINLAAMITEVSDQLRHCGAYDDTLYGDYGIPVFLELQGDQVRMNGHRLTDHSEKAVERVTKEYGVRHGDNVVFNFYETEAELGFRTKNGRIKGERIGPRDMLGRQYDFVDVKHLIDAS